jgi:hypothetical protein
MLARHVCATARQLAGGALLGVIRRMLWWLLGGLRGAKPPGRHLRNKADRSSHGSAAAAAAAPV